MAIIMAMYPRPCSIAEARNHLPRVVREVERGRPVGFTRRGRLVAVLLSEPEYRRLNGGGSQLRQALDAFLKDRPAGGVLTLRELASLRGRSPGRAVRL